MLIPDDRMAAEDMHGWINYRICTALDMIKFGMVLDEMTGAGILHPAERKVYEAMASALIAAVRNSNNRAFGRDPKPPIR